MKVLYILHSSIMGGATISFLNLVKRLLEKDVEVTIISSDESDGLHDFVQQYNIKVYTIPIRECWQAEYEKTFVHRLYHNFRFHLSRIVHYKDYLKMCRIVKEEWPDIVHTNVGIVQDGFYVAKKYGIPHVWHLREYQDADFNMRPYPSMKGLSELLRKSYVIAITKDILHHFNLQEDDAHRVIYNGVMSNQERCFIKDKEKFFLCASRVSPEKGHMDTIKAFAVIYKKYPEYRLKILGFGDKRFITELEDKAKELGCNRGIDFIGYTSDVSSYMKRAKALIVASKYEGFGRMTAEAFFNGCLVIGRNTGGTKEILDLTGGLAFIGDYNMLAKKMEDTINMKDDKYSEIVLKGQDVVSKLFSNEANVDSIYLFYNDILNEKH